MALIVLLFLITTAPLTVDVEESVTIASLCGDQIAEKAEKAGSH